ncbi:hypothetical protein LOTGIDRAFT_141037, partial [Lottia gigantea]
IFQSEAPYLRDRWCQFDGVMVLFLWTSVVLQVFEITNRIPPNSPGSALRILRSPRPLLIVRVFRVFLKFELPRNRINQIFKRSSQQIYNVTIFFLFFMSLYGILGVQFFGEMQHHCVKNGTDLKNVTVWDLAVPDTYCSPDPSFGYQCKNGMVCEYLDLPKEIMGFNGFDMFTTSIFTVYQAASQEGWVFLMYRSIDSLPAWKCFLYFISLIFFLAWLVKNVFIAVIIETFAEIRVQFQQMWGSRGSAAQSDSSQVIQSDGESWKLVIMDENKTKGLAPDALTALVKSNLFHTLILILVLAAAITEASLHFDHKTKNPKDTLDNFYYSEVSMVL